jgi:LPS-assembly protein
MRFRPNHIALLLSWLFASPVVAGEVDEPSLQLDHSAINIQGDNSSKQQEETPVFISAQQMEGKKGGQIEATGEVELRKRGQTISADHLLYLQDNKDVLADGSVRVEQDNNVILSPHLKFNLDTNTGDMTQPVFEFGDIHAHGKAEELHLAGRQDYLLHNVIYTTCPIDHDDWLLKMNTLEIDRDSQLGIAHGARVDFMGVPILYTPWMDFPLNSQRKSGFLAPSYGSTVTGGFEITVPYYWNIAPNLDATLAPRIISKRGNMLNNEVRYLEPAYSGIAHLNILNGDRLTNSTRLLFSLNHTQNFTNELNGSINYNRVSDDFYFRDFSDSVAGTSQTTLTREGVLSYTGGWWNAATRIQSFQTLQDPAAPVVPPYNRLPQFIVGAQQTVSKQTLAFSGEFVAFRHPTLVNGQRLVLYPSISYALVSQPAYYLTPKFGLHYTSYVLGTNNSAALPNASRALPIFSLDSGLTMERDMRILDKEFVQTLEPRAYYVYIPYRNQNQLPNFDSAQGDFNLAQMFTENRYLGNDRIGDANQVTLAVTSRLLQQNDGEERLRVAVGERFSTTVPKVNLPPATSTVTTPGINTTGTVATTKSDIVLAAFGQLTHAWSLDSTYQITPDQLQTEQLDASARYQPETGKVVNLGYRFTRNSLRQINVSSQWPLSGHWRGVASWNYSLQDGSILEALGGLEYNQQCWTVRIVAQRFPTATQQIQTSLFVQLELNDLVAVGTGDPLPQLRQNVPGYSKGNL